jgi:CheY-like chemotaxis protein
MTPYSHGRRLSVLVVDDYRDAADTLSVLLRLNGHETRVAYRGADALAIVRDWQPDVAILDVVMDGLSGVELAARIRREATRPVLFVALTGVGTNGEIAEVKAGSFDYVLLKPAAPNDLLGLLDARACRRATVLA